MNISTPMLAAVLAVAAALGGTVFAQDLKKPELIATIPHPGFVENLTERSDGSIYLTAAFDRIIWKVSPDHKVEKFATYPDYALILGIAPLKGGFVVAAFKRNFVTSAGVDFSDVGSELLLLDRNGKITATVAGAKGAAFNGLVSDGRGKYLIADSHLPVIWQFDPASKKISEWLRDDALAVSSPRDIGGDGLKVAGETVYVSNKAALTIYKVDRNAAGLPKGVLTLAAKNLPTADDFAVTPEGTIYDPAPDKPNGGHDTTLAKVSPSGQVAPFVADAAYAASAIVSRDGKWLIWATAVNGGVENKEQQLRRVAIP